MCWRTQDILSIRCTWEPNQAMHMLTSTVLPLKSQPVVSSTKYTNIININELFNAMMNQSEMLDSPGVLCCDCCLNQDRQDRWDWWALATKFNSTMGKKMVGRPSVFTMVMRRLCCWNQYCLVPRKLAAQWSNRKRLLLHVQPYLIVHQQSVVHLEGAVEHRYCLPAKHATAFVYWVPSIETWDVWQIFHHGTSSSA